MSNNLRYLGLDVHTETIALPSPNPTEKCGSWVSSPIAPKPSRN